MQTYVTLLRGVNVGGNNLLPMQAFRELLATLGAKSVNTYLQSGSAVFQHAASNRDLLTRRLERSLKEQLGLVVPVFLLTRTELDQAIATNPFPQANDNPKSLHVFFLAEAPTAPELSGLESTRMKAEAYSLCGKFFYLYTPEGFGKSKLATRVDQLLGVKTTARNWRSVCEIAKIAHTLGQSKSKTAG